MPSKDDAIVDTGDSCTDTAGKPDDHTFRREIIRHLAPLGTPARRCPPSRGRLVGRHPAGQLRGIRSWWLNSLTLASADQDFQGVADVGGGRGFLDVELL